MKIRELTDVEKFYVENNLDKGVDELASELKTSKKTVENFLETLPEENKQEQKVSKGRDDHFVMTQQKALNAGKVKKAVSQAVKDKSVVILEKNNTKRS